MMHECDESILVPPTALTILAEVGMERSRLCVQNINRIGALGGVLSGKEVETRAVIHAREGISALWNLVRK